MTQDQQEALLTIALLAAFSDGVKAEAERAEIRRIAEGLADGFDGAPNIAHLYQDVLLKRVDVAAAARKLSDLGQRQLAYEMAVSVCDADGQQSAPERKFLADLRSLLGLDSAQTQVFDTQATDVADALATPLTTGAAALQATNPAPLAVVPIDDAELDRSIQNYALLNGALELLPQSWASMAIIPLQIRMVYGIGKAHGVTLDQGHVREFIAAAGVGLTSQYLEQFGRKLLGGLLGKVAGRAIGAVGGAATGMAMSFATTYALGHLAKRYYASGRVMSTTLLRETYQALLAPAREMQVRYLPQMQQKAATLDAAQVLALVRGR
ncbi:MAG: TerB family tellurite resistance protein [Rhodoferax sp.]|nr:TerB family tellurite resistance protein [Rhodoferax sp.]